VKRLLLAHLNKQVNTIQGPQQLIHCPWVNVEDAINYLFKQAHNHLEKSGSMVRIMFFDFSNAFDAI